MGRYYTGDIEGKFWFGVQDSTDAKHFGGKETLYTNRARYTFRNKDLPQLQSVLAELQEQLGDKYEKLEEFFVKRSSYNPKELEAHLGVTTQEYKKIMEIYARIFLGLKIEECIGNIGKCSFWAELW
jgi:hypothetical protein